MIVLPPAVVELGGYINGFKLLPFALISLVWLRLMTWADKDADGARLPRQTTNLIHLGLWILGIGLAVVMPLYIVAVALFIVFLAVDVAIYLSMRKKSVGLNDLSKQFADWRKNFRQERKGRFRERACRGTDRQGWQILPAATRRQSTASRLRLDSIDPVTAAPLQRPPYRPSADRRRIGRSLHRRWRDNGGQIGAEGIGHCCH